MEIAASAKARIANGGDERAISSVGEMARATGLEPATSGVTGRRSNQLSYARKECGEPRRPAVTRDPLRETHGPVKPMKCVACVVAHAEIVRRENFSSWVFPLEQPGLHRRLRTGAPGEWQRQHECTLSNRRTKYKGIVNMSTTSATQFGSGLTGAPRAANQNRRIEWIRARIEAYRRWRERRAAVTALSALDGHLLRDIGIDRSEIVSLVYGGGGDPTRRART